MEPVVGMVEWSGMIRDIVWSLDCRCVDRKITIEGKR